MFYNNDAYITNFKNNGAGVAVCSLKCENVSNILKKTGETERRFISERKKWSDTRITSL